MKKFLVLICTLIVLFTSSCNFFKHSNSKIESKLNKNIKYERIIITSTRLAGRYTIFDQTSIKRFMNEIYGAKNVEGDITLQPDFFIEFYDSNKKVATFKYIAGITDENQPNLIDEEGNKYYVDSSIEDEFIKRIMKKEMFKGASDYYISLLEDVLNRIKQERQDNIKVYIDINKDYLVIKYLTSVDMRNIYDSVKIQGIEIVENENQADYVINIVTSEYKDTKVVANVSIKDKSNYTKKLFYEGNRVDGKITSYFIKNK
ncbi:hypothetical protein [Thermobrachium celere]|uniref:hypothetical protein n=1 Tax=Thermobrachium celere TaxID=53422 RepID=UPI001945A4C8|nr:hypothetical protein [Thermobrachium celere]GFR34450.1 hypothetical protein TCEA9_02620 [Thermobrachium celere]